MDQDENNKLTRRNFIRAIGGLALSASVIGLVPEALASAKDTDTTLRNKIKKSSIFNSFLDESDVAQFKFNLNDSYIMATPENKDIYAVFIPHSKQKKLEDGVDHSAPRLRPVNICALQSGASCAGTPSAGVGLSAG